MRSLFSPKRPTVSGLPPAQQAKVEELLAILDDKPGDLRARRNLGDAYRAAGKSDAAVEQYQALVGAYAAQGLLFRAIAACKLILAVKPDDNDATMALAELYARRTAGKESAELSGPMSAALIAKEDGDGTEVDDAEAGPVSMDEGEFTSLPPPVPADADEDIIDVTALAAALTPLPEGSVRLERPPAVPLFSGLSPASFQAVVNRLGAWQAEPGAIIVGEGEESDSVFVVVRGRVRVERGGVVLAVLGNESFFGEMALLSRRPRAASVIADVTTELLEIPRGVLEDLVDQDPGVAVALEQFSRARLLDTLARTSGVLRDLPADVVKGALAQFDKRVVPAGAVVVHEGAQAAGLFVVLHGELDVVAAGELGPIRVKRLAAGDVFGEMSLLTGDPASASVVATSECSLLVLAKDAFGAFANANPALAERLRALASSRRAMNDQLLVADLPDETSSAVLV